ncbi:MAG: type II toxin-antitoxin system RelE/ParE family toxin [Pirellulaceae bacterium]|nr:type II toxin-antitoxin system RelE/ParE family toxin [Pirellulaceae bacterium]
MRIKLSGGAERDLERGCDFYRNIDPDLAIYFYDCLASDIDSLVLYAGVHASVDGWHYTFSKRFPFVIWYGVSGGMVNVYAVLDGRSEPSENDAILRRRPGDNE